MKVLALETAGWGGGVALLEWEREPGADRVHLRSQGSVPAGTRTAAGLAPLLDAQFQSVGWSPRELDLVAVTGGPGSFTGLRTGVTTAKVLAYAADAAILDVNTLHAIASGYALRQAPGQAPGRLSVVMDAQRRELFSMEFAIAGGQAGGQSDCQIEPAQSWLARQDGTVRVAGPGLQMKLADGDTLQTHLLRSPSLASAIVAPEDQVLTAESVGRLAISEYAASRRADVWSLVPSYYRLSAAEEKARRH